MNYVFYLNDLLQVLWLILLSQGFYVGCMRGTLVCDLSLSLSLSLQVFQVCGCHLVISRIWTLSYIWLVFCNGEDQRTYTIKTRA